MINAKTKDGYLIVIPYSFNGYRFKKVIGQGSTSIVCAVEDINTGELFSAKIIPKMYVQVKNIWNQINTEISVMKKINHPNIVKIYDSFDFKNDIDDEFIILIMEYCENGDLFQLLTKNGFNNDFQKQIIIHGFLQSIKYLHDNGIAHGDIKPENILLDSYYNAKLSDFGYCKTNIISGDESKSGTLYYAAPELFIKGKYNSIKTDIWSIGILLYCLSEKRFPFANGNKKCIRDQITRDGLSIASNVDEKLRKIVQKCTQFKPENRPSIEEIIEDEYFTGINKNTDFLIQDNIDPFSIENDHFSLNYEILV